jgi:hypothetical protein
MTTLDWSGGMLNIRIKKGLVLEMHDATERVTLPSGREVWAYVSLKKSWDLSLEGSDRFCRSTLLGF